MPEKSRERRVKQSKRSGQAKAIKSSDVGNAFGLSTHAAKKSRHVEGMRKLRERTVSRQPAPGEGKWGGEEAGGRNRPSPVTALAGVGRVANVRPPGKKTPRTAGELERKRARPAALSRRRPSKKA